MCAENAKEAKRAVKPRASRVLGRTGQFRGYKSAHQSNYAANRALAKAFRERLAESSRGRASRSRHKGDAVTKQ